MDGRDPVRWRLDGSGSRCVCGRFVGGEAASVRLLPGGRGWRFQAVRIDAYGPAKRADTVACMLFRVPWHACVYMRKSVRLDGAMYACVVCPRTVQGASGTSQTVLHAVVCRGPRKN